MEPFYDIRAGEALLYCPLVQVILIPVSWVVIAIYIWSAYEERFDISSFVEDDGYHSAEETYKSP